MKTRMTDSTSDRTASCAPFTNQRGVGLMEVLITMLLVSVSLVGLAGVQATTLRLTHEAGLRAEAARLAEEFTEYMRSAGPHHPFHSQWERRLQTRLGAEARASVAHDGKLVTITLEWPERSPQAQGHDALQRLTHAARL
ncbi:MAG: hypothetical protein RBT55_04940 [Rhodocyclaceae bacterium]|jgi:type IV pilus assembly protein PilV|nr:hypothetical protein [Rhodocyclaceae bacterium]